MQEGNSKKTYVLNVALRFQCFLVHVMFVCLFVFSSIISVGLQLEMLQYRCSTESIIFVHLMSKMKVMSFN